MSGDWAQCGFPEREKKDIWRDECERLTRKNAELKTDRDALAEALKKIDQAKMPDLSDDLLERSMQLAGLWAAMKMIAKSALSNLDGGK